MNKLLIDYCKYRLTNSNFKPEYKEVTNASFAKFIMDVAECIDELRVIDKQTEFDYGNVESDFSIDSRDLSDMFEDGISVILDKNSDGVEKESGAEKIKNAAFCGLCSAQLLFGLHLICDSRASKDFDLGITLLFWAGESMVHEGLNNPWLDDILIMSQTKKSYPFQNVNVNSMKYAHFYYDNDGEWAKADQIGLVCRGWNAIGSIRICVDWYEKQIEIFDKDDRIDVYVVPYLPTWYVMKCICDKVGEERTNLLAGIRLCDVEEAEDSLAVVFLREDPDDNVRGFTHLFYNNDYFDFNGAFFWIEMEDGATTVSNRWDEEDNCWIVTVPSTWGKPLPFELKNQRMLTRYINNMLPKVAEKYLPMLYENLLNDNELPKGKCSVSILGKGQWYENDEGGYDVTVPFTAIKLPCEILSYYLLKPYIEPGSEEDKKLKRFKDFETYTETLASVDYKLLTSKLKRESLQDTYGRLLFG